MKDRVIKLLALLIVLAISLSLLVYVGFGEANRTYPTFQMDKLAAQGEIIKNSMETFLKAGLPLKDYIGFSTLADPILDTDESISSILVMDANNNNLFSKNRDNQTGISDFLDNSFNPSLAEKKIYKYQVFENDTTIKVSLSLSNKFEVVGYLWVFTQKSLISQTINTRFKIVVYIMLGLLVVFAIFYLISEKRLSNRFRYFLEISYGTTFLIMAGVVIYTLIILYAQGIQGKTAALASSLSQRINSAIELGLHLDNFEGLDRTFVDYKKVNPDISAIALVELDKISIHTNPDLIGKPWKSDSSQYENKIILDTKKTLAISINLAIPKKVIFYKLLRSIKNFVVLFAASAFLAFLFLNLLTSLNSRKEMTQATVDKIDEQDFQLELVKPIFFITVFIEGLHSPFLPQYFQKITASSGLADNMASLLFTVFFIFFALVLVPAGRYAEERGCKGLMLTGIFLAALSQFSMAFVTDYYWLILIRGLAGMGQGIVFIGVQSHILNNASKSKSTQGAGIIVYAYNGGMISGVAIGGLLLVNMGIKGIFFTEAAIAIFNLWFIYSLISKKVTNNAEKAALNIIGIFKSILIDAFRVISNFEFIKTLVLVGLSTKAVLTGIIIFALPLLLTKMEYAKEDIGQVLMFYAAGVLISSKYVSKLTDRIGQTTVILFIGSIVGGLGLILIGMMSRNEILALDIKFLPTIILILGMSLLGLAHGFIQAPVITHISNTNVAEKVGKSSTASVYRFLERLGHVVGPIIVGQILILSNYSITAISWIGSAILLFGFLFLLGYQKQPSEKTGKE
jgi:MFS family permease